MNPITVLIFVYVLAQLAIGGLLRRRIKTEEDYLLGGRSLGYSLLIMTVFATWFGAETCIGAAGAIYTDGLSGGSADPFGYALCVLFMGAVFAYPLWKLKLTTPADFYRLRYSPAVERLTVIITVPTSLLWAAAQVRAFGQVVSSVSGIPVATTITIAAGCVILYSLLGGFLADVWTDVLQGIALSVGLVALLIAVLRAEGVAAVAAIESHRLGLFGGALPTLDTVEAWAIPIIGSVMAPELISRVIAARSGRVARGGTLAAGGIYLCIGLVPAILGLLGAGLVPGLEDPEQILPRLAEIHLPGVLYVAFAGAVLSAILSTADSTLLVSASLVAHNLVLPRLGDVGERARVRINRAGVALFGLVAYGLAFSAEGVYALVEQASAFGSAGIFVATAAGLWSRRGGTASALGALVAGVVFWIAGAYVLGWAYPFLTSVAAAAVAYALGMLVGGEGGETPRESGKTPNKTR
jgi:Na+/proline symporter